MKPAAPKVEEPVSQSSLLRILLIAEHGERQFVGWSQNFQIANEHFDFACGELRVDKLFVAHADIAVDANDMLRAHAFHRREQRAFRVGQHLREPEVVAKVDEQHSAVVADPMNPTREPYGFAYVARAQLAAVVRSVWVHVRLWSKCEVKRRHSLFKPERVKETKRLSSAALFRFCRLVPDAEHGVGCRRAIPIRPKVQRAPEIPLIATLDGKIGANA